MMRLPLPAHLDALIRIIAPDYEPETIGPKVRPPEGWSKRGQLSRMVLSILRTAKEPLTSREIASQLILGRGLAMDDKLLRVMTKRVLQRCGTGGRKGRCDRSRGRGRTRYGV